MLIEKLSEKQTEWQQRRDKVAEHQKKLEDKSV